ncbi:hypothetical protein M409DRAFT_19457 [Zasmidium cellare ATCC 36951]|uniref:Ecp2 effector protein domain-containing protein n=1 Tax=Zasmidium cellare ATCC 36951 TaxID=1080233 RepID=A0A6A6CXQ4_ZASCE|nr:uncharacterized protein M409DRAFT_19457 [Zasmidium cellare ATCC 36951]KAF2170642.1 hypothetical protein M409DRAFT_19457 [Zasmidium cellare ATCC 36951]
MINFMLTFAIALIGITGSLAAPVAVTSTNITTINARDDYQLPGLSLEPIEADNAKCSVGVLMNDDTSATRSYNVHIGRPYAEGSGCEYIRDTIAQKASDGAFEFKSGTYKCLDDGSGNTFLTFAAGDVFNLENNADVIDALQQRYPMIPFKDNGICRFESNPGRTRSIPINSHTLTTRDGPIDHNTALCSYSRVSGTGGSLDLGMDKCEARVGRDYINGAGCAPIRQTLQSLIPDGISAYSCVDDGYGYTQLAFNVWNARAIYYDINTALQKAYQDIPFIHDHICG